MLGWKFPFELGPFSGDICQFSNSVFTSHVDRCWLSQPWDLTVESRLIQVWAPSWEEWRVCNICCWSKWYKKNILPKIYQKIPVKKGCMKLKRDQRLHTEKKQSEFFNNLAHFHASSLNSRSIFLTMLHPLQKKTPPVGWPRPHTSSSEREPAANRKREQGFCDAKWVRNIPLELGCSSGSNPKEKVFRFLFKWTAFFDILVVWMVWKYVAAQALLLIYVSAHNDGNENANINGGNEWLAGKK